MHHGLDILFGERAQLPRFDVRKKQHGVSDTCLSHKSCGLWGRGMVDVLQGLDVSSLI